MDWNQIMENPEFWQLALAIVTGLGIAYGRWMQVRTQRLKNDNTRIQKDLLEMQAKYEEIKGDNADNAALLSIVRETLLQASERDKQRVDERAIEMQMFRESVDKYKSTSEAVVQLAQNVSEFTAMHRQELSVTHRAIAEESTATRESVETAAKDIGDRIDNLLQRFDTVEQTLSDNQARHVTNAQTLRKTEDFLTEVVPVLRDVKQYLDGRSTNELQAVSDD